MSEETGGGEAGQAGLDTGGLAMDLAMEEARSNPSLRDEAAGFLRNQSTLVDIQKHHLHEQFKQLRLATLSQRLTVALKFATGAVGVAVLLFLGAVVWNASQASGLVVEAFSVPPQFSQAGITGEVLSDDLNSKLGVIRDTLNASSLVRAGDVSVNRDNEIRVEIPETGISMGQGWHYLRLWFGHERRLRGNLRSLDDGRIALSVALDDTNPLTVAGPSGDLDRLEQRAAEHVYADLDPGQFAIYLRALGRTAEAYAAIERGAGSPLWAAFARRRDPKLALARSRIVVAADPKGMTAHRELALAYLYLGYEEDVLREAGVMQTLPERDQEARLQGRSFAALVSDSAFLRASGLGDFSQAARTGCPRCSQGGLVLRQAEYYARAHDVTQSRQLIAEVLARGLAPETFNLTRSSPNRARYYLSVATGNWQGAVAEAHAYIAVIKAEAGRSQLLDAIPGTVTSPMLSVALAHTDDFKGAHAAADGMPADCYHCLRARGQITALEKNWSGADTWFGRAVNAAPSLPFAYSDWGKALLDRGDADGGISKFSIAHQKGPHFADPLVYWGEALMTKNQSHLALAKFAQANQYAPNWGRLHLKWGEALFYAGKKDAAKKYFTRAASLDLTPVEKAELAKFIASEQIAQR